MSGSGRFSADKRVLGHRVSFVAVAALLLFAAVLLPFAISGVFGYLVSPPTSRVYRLLTTETPSQTHLRLHFDVVSLDENAHTAGMRVTGHQVCSGRCQERLQVLIVSLRPAETKAEGLPPSTTVAPVQSGQEVTATVTLPVHGNPIHYPFDRYLLGFGIVLQRVLPDGTVQSLSAEEAADRLVSTLQVELPRLDMSGPHPVDASRIEATGGTYPFLIVDELTFERSLYLRVLTVLLVLLVAAAAAFAVFLRPLNELVIDVGALVIGIWGIRSILVGIDAPPGSSVVDLSLSIVILFLFAAITVRALMFLDERARLNVLHPQRRMKDNIPADTDAATERIAAPPDERESQSS